MARDFDYFVVLADMRTGSNFLEANLNEFSGLICHGEAFNPHFVGHKDQMALLGVNLRQREADPMRLIAAMQDQDGVVPGFRFFHDHDPRILKHVLTDRRCAKVVLQRNPVDSYVSRKIAVATGQWRLTNVTHKKTAKAVFDAGEFRTHLEQLGDFQTLIQNTLQRSGQTAFYIRYEDINDLDVMNGLGRFLGANKGLDSLNGKLKKQNPEPISEKVENFDEMQQALARIDMFALSELPSFEPRKGPLVPSYVAGHRTPLLFMPVQGGPVQAIKSWMAAIDGVGVDDLTRDFTQKSLRQWKRQNPGHRTFTVVTHPLERAHTAFCRHILMLGPECYPEVRGTLRKVHKLPIPEGAPGADYDASAHRAAFLGFLEFVKANLSGQTSVRIDPAWASQTNVLQGFAQFGVPDLVIRAERLIDDLAMVTSQIGKTKLVPVDIGDEGPVPLSAIYDGEVERAARDAYQRDYMMFGYQSWVDPAHANASGRLTGR